MKLLSWGFPQILLCQSLKTTKISFSTCVTQTTTAVLGVAWGCCPMAASLSDPGWWSSPYLEHCRLLWQRKREFHGVLYSQITFSHLEMRYGACAETHWPELVTWPHLIKGVRRGSTSSLCSEEEKWKYVQWTTRSPHYQIDFSLFILLYLLRHSILLTFPFLQLQIFLDLWRDYLPISSL